MWLNQDSLARSLIHAAFTPEVRIHIDPPIFISRFIQNYSTPIQERIAKNILLFLFFPVKKNAQVILVTTTCYIISGDECSKKKKEKKKKIRGNKKGQVPGTSKEKKVRREVKMDKCPTVQLGVQDTHLREKKKKIQSISFSSESFKRARKVCIPSKEHEQNQTFKIVITIITIHHSFVTHAHLDLTY